MENEIKFRDISKIEQVSTDFSRFADDYIFARITARTLPLTLNQQGFRYEGLAFILVKSGEIKVGINMQPTVLKERSLLSTSSRTVINIADVDWENLEAYILILSPEFMRNVTIDLSTLAATTTPFTADNNRRYSIVLTPDEFELISRCFELFHLNTSKNTNEVYVKSIARSIAAALFYQLMHISNSRIEDKPQPRPISRRMNYVHDFMELIHKHYRKERSVAFYADKLFISPKYLSLIIKETTGRSASDWIDDSVILEAKNLLKFSGMNIQQIAYELNFNNQSSFGKYFKHITGMSPTKFQQS